MIDLNASRSKSKGICNERRRSPNCKRTWELGDEIAWKNPLGVPICVECAIYLTQHAGAQWTGRKPSLLSVDRLNDHATDKTARPPSTDAAEPASMLEFRLTKEIKELKEQMAKMLDFKDQTKKAVERLWDHAFFPDEEADQQ